MMYICLRVSLCARVCSYWYRICFFFQAEDGIRDLVRSRGLGDVYKRQLQFCDGNQIDKEYWENGHYHPTPTIIEAARALYLSLIHI